MQGLIKKRSVWAALTMTLAAGLLGGGAPDRAAFEAALVRETAFESARPLRIVLLADKKDHGPAGNGLHDYPLWQERWALLLGGRDASLAAQGNLDGSAVTDAALEAGAAGVTVERATGWPSEEQFAAADVIVAYCYLTWTDARKRQLAAYLERGGGLAVLHSATWTKPKADQDVASLLGVGGFTKYRHGAVRVEVNAPEHPIWRILPQEFALDDETYWPPTPPVDPSRVTVLAVSLEKEEDGARQPQPVFWTFETGRGRVFGCVPGHAARTFDAPWFRLVLLRGIAWTAGGCPYRFDYIASRGVRFNTGQEKKP